ncbi:MAG TPA: efflux RND transporter periplasmic adaptor subunit [Gammaproteobacteria bacterium]|nr:efflux RND transporter periplasmic adaptor subunit [Gammaproteobacteria bacterium]
MLTRRQWKLAVPLLLAVMLLAWGFWPRPVLVEIAHVAPAPLTVSIEEEGKTRVIDRYEITAPVTGVTSRLAWDVGDTVGRDQVLLGIKPLTSEVLDPRREAEARARVAAARAALHAAEQNAHAAVADTEFADLELQRISKLADSGNVSRGELDRARTRARSARAVQRSAEFDVEVARYKLDAARTTLQYAGKTTVENGEEKVQVRAPVSGSVLAVQHLGEGPVKVGQPLLEIGDTRALEVEVEVLSEDAIRIRPGMRVLFERWGGAQPLEGRVRVVEPVGFTKISALGVEEQRVHVIADLVSPYKQWQKLGDGYRVEARFIVWQADDVLQVPSSALFRHQGQWAVFVVAAGRAVLRTVEVGQRNGLQAQIVSGLEDGEAVISYPSDAVGDGVRVRLR